MLISDKKGISPLIATVLIIGFTIVLAVLVITWISGTVEEQTDQTDCQVEAENLCLDVIGDITISYSDDTNPIALNNLGSTVIENNQVLQLDSNGQTIANTLETVGLDPFGTNETAANLNSGTETIRVIPVMTSDGGCTAECTPVEVTVV